MSEEREQLAVELFRRTGHKVDPDDAVVVVYEIGMILADENRAIFSAHRSALEEVMKTSVSDVTGQLNASVEKFQSETLQESLQEKIAQLAEFKAATVDAVSRMRRLAFMSGVCVFLNLLLLGISLGVMHHILS